MINGLSRRRFLKIAGASAGVAAVGGSVGGLLRKAQAGRQIEHGLRHVPTFCDMCFWRCGGIATVRDGSLWKFEGNPDDPLSHGRLCPRGTGGVGAHYDSDRLRTPLIRRSARGEEQWTAVTWDEALGYVAERMQKIKAELRPRGRSRCSTTASAAPSSSTRSRPSARPTSPRPSFAQCRGPRDVGFTLTFGEEVGSPERTDIGNTRCLVLIGSHLGENMHNTQVQEFAEAVERRIDHRRRSRASRSPRARRSTGCRSSRAPTSRCCSRG